jgi:4-diphosphocytidyl-2-C-methyl-D-erythritol kinase
MADNRHVRVHSLAKVNLSLEVLNLRPDGYHNIRTLFQTISLHDEIAITVESASETTIDIDSDIPDNLIVKAARLVLDELGETARIRFAVVKRIPMGAGLGGGSSNAAAVLLALPALLGRSFSLDRCMQLAGQLGSDVPFFLMGGTALGLSRGEDLYPVGDVRYNLLLATPDLHVATPDAYRSLARNTSYVAARNAARDFLLTGEPSFWTNDFEAAVFTRNSELAGLQARLTAAGVQAVRMTGSGSTLFGVCPTEAVATAAREAASPTPVHTVQAVNRLRYRALWWRQLSPYAREGTWPPQP